MNNILQTESVTKIYESNNLTVKAVDQVSISVAEGEFVALVGPSGSGKTTMLAMLAGLLESTEGRLLIDGHNLGSMNDIVRTRFRRQHIGFTFQSNNLVPYLTALENVELMLRLNKKYGKDGRDRAVNLLTRLGLEDRLDNLPKQLSGGQQQRVAIARALINNPAVILADEPSGNLDSNASQALHQLFLKLRKEFGHTFVIVTHNKELANLADRKVEIIDGIIFKENNKAD